MVPETIPLYEDVNPEGLREAAQQIRAGGADYAKDAAGMDRAWNAGTDASYLKGAAKPTLLEVLHPVATRAVPVDQALQASAKALDVYADSCEKIKKALKRLRADAEDFVARMKRLEAHGEKWDQYPANVEENDRLKAAVGKQETAFSEAESLCSGSISAAYGADSGMSGPPAGHPAGMPLPAELERMGREAADLAKKAAAGDERAYADLMAYKGLETNPAFATAFIGALGAAGLVALPRGMKAPRNEGPNRYTKPERGLLAFLGGALATATNPENKTSLGPKFLQDLQDAGRRTIPGASPTGSRSFGYHGLAAILGQKPKGVSFSPEFMKTVGRDMIDFDRDVRSGKIRVPAPGPQPGTRIFQDMASYLPELMHAVEGNREGAQILLDHTPEGYKTSNLHYMLREQADVWTDDPKTPADDWKGKALGAAMEAAMTGQDQTSKQLTTETIKILGEDVRTFYDRNAIEKLELTDPDAFNRLAGIRGSLGKIFASHIGDIGEVINTTGDGFGQDTNIKQGDLNWALLYAASDDGAFRDMVRAQGEHMRKAIDSIFPLTPKGQDMISPIVREGYTFGHLLEARNQAVLADGRATETENKEIRDMVREAIGIFPVPAKEFAGPLAKQAFKGLGLEEFAKNISDQAFDKSSGYAYDKAAAWVAQQHGDGRTLDSAYDSVEGNGALVQRMMDQMIASSIIAHGEHNMDGLSGRSFMKDGQLRPLAMMTPEQYEAFLRWVTEHSKFSNFKDRGMTAIDNAANRVHESFGIDK